MVLAALSDVRTWRPPRRHAVWRDRALFHFMGTDEDRDAYLRTLDEAIGTERALVIIATFAPDGPLRCSGLPVARYSATDLEAALGTRWQMINECRELHTTPSGTIGPFTWTASVARPRQASHATCVSGVLDHSCDEARRRYGAATSD
jgi:hypothetical protein